MRRLAGSALSSLRDVNNRSRPYSFFSSPVLGFFKTSVRHSFHAPPFITRPGSASYIGERSGLGWNVENFAMTNMPALFKFHQFNKSLMLHGGAPVNPPDLYMIQHLTSTGLINLSIMDDAFGPNNFYVSGKHYSTDDSELARQMRGAFCRDIKIDDYKPDKLGDYKKGFPKHVEKVFRQALLDSIDSGGPVLAFDEGGHLRALAGQIVQRVKKKDRMQKDLVLNLLAVEHTTRGLRKQSGALSQFPTINMAESALKRLYEPGIIAEELLKGVMQMAKGWGGQEGPDTSIVCVVVGKGIIGDALEKYLLEIKYDVYTCDKNELHDPENLKSQSELIKNMLHRCIRNSDKPKVVIKLFGCTGTQLPLDEALLGQLTGSGKEINVQCYSCSSEDVEFSSLLSDMRNRGVNNGTHVSISINDECANGRLAYEVSNHGFPINFLGKSELAAPYVIQLTRMLVYAATMQGAQCLRTDSHDMLSEYWRLSGQGETIAMDPYLQLIVLMYYRDSLNEYNSMDSSDGVDSFKIDFSGFLQADGTPRDDAVGNIVAASGGQYHECSYWEEQYNKLLQLKSIRINQARVMAIKKREGGPHPFWKSRPQDGSAENNQSNCHLRSGLS